MNKALFLMFFVFSLFFVPTNTYAFKEDFNFLILEVPFNWKIKSSNEKEFTLENKDKTATFSYKIMPVYDITIEQFADAIMKASSGYSLKLRASGVYRFEFIAAGKPAWSIVNFCGQKKPEKNAEEIVIANEQIACIQTGVGNSEDFAGLIDAGQLK